MTLEDLLVEFLIEHGFNFKVEPKVYVDKSTWIEVFGDPKRTRGLVHIDLKHHSFVVLIQSGYMMKMIYPDDPKFFDELLEWLKAL